MEERKRYYLKEKNKFDLIVYSDLTYFYVIAIPDIWSLLPLKG
jgi:hypothetical protein